MVMVGGNGRQVTWRLAARYADELNVDAMPPDEFGQALPVIHSPARRSAVTPPVCRFRFACGAWTRNATNGSRSTSLIAGYRDLGVSRVMALLPGVEDFDEPLHEYLAVGSEASPA